MSVTVAHRPGFRVPWLQIAVVLAIAAVTVLAVALAIQSSSAPTAQTSAHPAVTDAAAASVSGAVAAKNRSPVVHAIMLGEAPAASAAVAPALSLKHVGAPWAAGQGW
jgi:hypothetical protein